MAAKVPAAPPGLAGPGRELWRAIVGQFELATHEQAQLLEACYSRDRIDQLRAQVDADGLMLESSQGTRLHPAVAEVRQQQIVLARLLAAIQVPGLDDEQTGAAVRGVYRPGRR